MTAGPPPFQRARTPEQVQARRAAILDAARDLLSQQPLADISLRELSRHAGLAKSNVLRYFDSREAVFLAVLDAEWGDWLDELEGTPPRPSGTGPPPEAHGASFAAETAFARSIAETLAARPDLCELASATSSVLERNIGVDTAIEFKRRATVHTSRLAQITTRRVPGIGEPEADRFATTAVVLTAAFWPFANPNESVRAATERLGQPVVPFADSLTMALADLLIGLTRRGENPGDTAPAGPASGQ